MHLKNRLRELRRRKSQRQCASDLVEDKDTAKQKFKLLHTITGISTEDIMLLCMVAKLFPKRRRSGGYARPS